MNESNPKKGKMIFHHYRYEDRDGSRACAAILCGRVVAYVYRDRDPNNGARSYRTYTPDGKEILPPNYSRHEVCRQLKDREQEFIIQLEKAGVGEQILPNEMPKRQRKRIVRKDRTAGRGERRILRNR